MKRIRVAAALVALLTVAGCDERYGREVPYQPTAGDARHVSTFHDDSRGVTCWLYGGTNGGISCLPDWMLEHSARMMFDAEVPE